MRPMLADPMPVSDLPKYIESDNHWFEQKLDGHRNLCDSVDGKVTVLNRSGNPYTKNVPRKIIDAFKGLQGKWVLDGELVDGTLWVFDLLAFQMPITHASLAARRETLEMLFEMWQPPECIKLVRIARTEDEKRDLVTEVDAIGGEGVMVKDKRAPYREATRSSKMLKAKFVSTVDCVVMEVGRQGKESMSVGVIDPDRRPPLVEIGAVTMIGKGMDKISVGDVVEVRYLYVVDGGTKGRPRLYQPHFERKRDDKPAIECTIDQLHYTDKAVLT